jgi:hypothetical protein
MYFDGYFTLNGAWGCIVLMPPKGDRLLYMIRLHFHTTNNLAAYEALVNSLHITTELGVQWRRTVMTPSWRHTNRTLESLRRTSMVSNFIISSSETTRQPTSLPSSGLAVSHPLLACSRRTCSNPPSQQPC